VIASSVHAGRGVALVLTLCWLGACSPDAPQVPPPPPVEAPVPLPEESDDSWFVDRAAASGLDFVHFNGMSGEFYFIEVFAPGGALFDYDNDGDLDVYLIQSGMLGEGKTLEDATIPYRGDSPLTDRLFRNELVESGALRFVDVTESAKIDAGGYGMGVAAADYDRDGWVDLYVTNYNSNQLLHNNGDGTFEDVTAASGTDDARWSTSAAFFDFDGDSWLDLFVVNYVDWTFASHKQCYSNSGEPDYCGPLSFQPYPDRLLRNRGDGTFEDVTGPSQIARAYGSGLGAIPADFNGDDRTDLYVANDGRANQLWINKGDGRFADEALMAGCAFNKDGDAEASMGVDAADYDNDGDVDLFMTHLLGETNTLYNNDGTAWFDDHTLVSGLGPPSRSYTGFGTGWFDYDSDGRLDLLVNNGAVKTIQALANEGDLYPLDQATQLFRGIEGQPFREVSGEAGPEFERLTVGRGAAFGDVDNDGDTDVLLIDSNGPVRLLVNRVSHDHDWLGLRLLDPSGKYDMLNARVEIELADGPAIRRTVHVAGSYCSSSDPRVLVGLGRGATFRAVRVRWPDGRSESWSDVPLGRYTSLLKGTGDS